MRKILSLFAAVLIALAANATIRNITPTHCFEGDRTDGYTLYVELARGAQAGDTIVLADGEYLEGQSIYVNVPVVVMAAEGAHPVVKQASYVKLLASAKFVGIKFMHNAESNGYCMYFQPGCTRLELQDCEITNFKETCIMSWDTYSLDSLIINNCYIHDNIKSAVYDPNGCIAHTVITNSTFANNDVSPWSAGLIDIRKGSTGDPKLVVDHCTFYHNLLTNSDYGEVRPRGLTGVLVSNCIFAQPADYERVATRFSDNSGNGEVRNVITHHYTKRTNQWGHYDGATYTACSMGDPLFVDAANGDYHLGAGSPAINYAGKDAQGADITVTLGDPRWYPAAPVEPILANGFYLIGQAGWDVAALDSTLKFAVNPANENEYMLHTTLAEGDSIKVVKVESDAIAAWYPAQGANYVVDAAHAGEKDIYFQEAYKADWAAFGGHIWIAENPAPQPIVGTHFVKVTEAPAEWAGEYLIVYEAGNVALNGALEALDAVSNTVAVEIANGKIASTEALIGARVTVAAMEGGYSLKAASGKYLAQYTYANGLASSDTAVLNTLSIDADGNAVIAVPVVNNNAVTQVTLRYNKASNQARFRYYKSGQEAIALYKLTTLAPEPEPQPKFCVTGDSALVVDGGAAADKAWTADALPSMNDTLVLNLKANQYYVLKVVDGANWYGYNELTEKTAGLIDDNAEYHNIGFTLAEAGAVKVIYKAGEPMILKLEGNFVEPTPQPAGLKAVSDSTTWDFAKVKAKTTSPLYSSSKEGILLTAETTPRITDEVIYADYDTTVLTIAAGFDAEAIAFTGEYPIRKDKYCMNGAVHFKTAVAGNIIVKFSDTGTSASATAVKRYLMVNGDSTQYWTSREKTGDGAYPAQLNVIADSIPVPAGDVVLTGSSAICVYYVTFIPEAPVVQHTYTVAGDQKAFGSNWNPADATNDMAKQEDGTYKWEKTDLTLAAGKVTFKVVEDHAWTHAWPASDYELAIPEAGIYTITITFNPAAEADKVAAVATKTGSAVVIPTVQLHGTFTNPSWATTDAFALAADSLSASLKLNLEAKTYEFGMKFDGTWKANGANLNRENPGTSLASGNGNMHMEADQAGEYIFTYFFAEDSLAVTYPKLIPHYGVHEAIAAATADPATLAVNDLVYVRGIITKIEFKGKNFANYGSACIYVADASGAADTLEFYNCYSMNADTFKTSDPAYDATSTAWAQFNSVADANGVEIALGDTIEAFGKYNLYNGVHQLNQGCYLTVVNKYQPILGEPDYYLVGTMNEWQADSAYKFVKNEGAEGIEYKLTVALPENAELKVMGLVANDTLWYPDQADNYVVDAAHAGEAMDIYFRPNADGGNDWYHGVIFVPANVPELPEIALIGGMNGWDGNQGKFAPAADYKSAAWTINLDTLPADRGYAFKLLVDGIAMGSARDSAGNPFTFTPANNVLRPVDHVAVGDDEIFWLHMEDKVGEYTFIYTFADSSLKVVYPKVLPTTAPAAPTADEDDVMAVYCNHYATNNLHFEILGWGGVQTWKADTIDGVAIAYCEDMKYEFLTNWGAPKYDMSEYNKIHIDIWAPAAASVRLGIEALGVGEGGSGSKVGVVYNLNEGWNSIDAALEDFGYDFKDMKYVFFEWYKTPEGESFENNPFGFANIYFYEKESQALDNTSDGVKAQKYIHNGMLLIEKNGKVYTITGQVVR